MENEKTTNLRFKLFLETKGITEEEYLQDRTKVKDIEYIEFIYNHIANYHKIIGNEEPVESNPEDFDDYLKFKVLGETLKKIAEKEENIGIRKIDDCKEAKELLEKYGLTKENDKTYQRLKTSFDFGVQKRITQNYRQELFNTLPEEHMEKYFKALSYEDELEEGKYTDMQRRLRIAENIDKIEVNPKQIKFLVYFSESGEFKENEILTLKEMTEKYNLAKENSENEYIKYTYRKVSLMLIIDDVESISIINLENYLNVPSYKNFEEYINENFSKQFIIDYLDSDLDKTQAREEYLKAMVKSMEDLEKEKEEDLEYEDIDEELEEEEEEF